MRGVFFSLLIALLFSTSSGYDTGHHNDLTRNVLQLFGYNRDVQTIAGAANFFVDYFAFTPLSGEVLPELNRMHFDNIFTLRNASNYWTQLTVNSRRAIQIAAQNGDALEFIMTVGGTMHTVQDFYTHSSWVDFFYRTECDCFRTETWISQIHSVNNDIDLLLDTLAPVHTYSYGECDENSRNCLPAQISHGDACAGINKDSYVRPYWEQSYAFAFAASVEWLENIHRWASEVNPAIIAAAQSYVPPSQNDIEDLRKLNDYLNTVSYAIKFRENDGHWKGPGSGSLKRFLPATVAFTASRSIYKQKYQDSKIHLRWSDPNVYDAADVDNTKTIDTTTIISITQPAAFTTFQKYVPVVVRTVSVRGKDSRNTPSYFATVTIDGLEFVETVQIDNADFTPHWTSVKFVDSSVASSVPIIYTLKNNKYPSGDTTVSILPSGADSLSLTYDLASHALSGDIIGTYDSISNTVTTRKDADSVAVQLFITSNRYANCTEGLPQQFCPNEAYVFVGNFDECEGETIPSSSVKLQSSLLMILAVVLALYML